MSDEVECPIRLPLRPRTKSERMALLTGFAMAIEAVADHGLEHARAALKLMFESEERTG